MKYEHERREHSSIRAFFRQAIPWLLSIGCLSYVLSQIDVIQLFYKFLSVDITYLSVALCALAIGYALRILRWKMLLASAGGTTSYQECARAYLGSIALNNVLPLRAGDVFRALVFPKYLGISRLISSASILWERLSDIIIILIIFLVANTLNSKSYGLILSIFTSYTMYFIVGLILIIFVLSIVVFIFRHRVRLTLHRILAVPRFKLGWVLIRQTTSVLVAMAGPSILAKTLLISMAAWSMETVFYWMLLNGLGLNTGIPGALMVTSVATLSTLIPSSPGYVGTFHIAAAGAISMMGATAQDAATFAVLAHAVLWGGTSLAGGIAVLMTPNLFIQARTNQTDV